MVYLNIYISFLRAVLQFQLSDSSKFWRYPKEFAKNVNNIYTYMTPSRLLMMIQYSEMEILLPEKASTFWPCPV